MILDRLASNRVRKDQRSGIGCRVTAITPKVSTLLQLDDVEELEVDGYFLDDALFDVDAEFVLLE